MSDNMNNLKEDTKILIFEGVITKEVDGQIMDSPQFGEVILSKESKEKIMEKLAIGLAMGYKNPLILAPISYLSRKPKHLTYPIAFQKCPIYFISYIKEVIVLESD